MAALFSLTPTPPADSPRWPLSPLHPSNRQWHRGTGCKVAKVATVPAWRCRSPFHSTHPKQIRR